MKTVRQLLEMKSGQYWSIAPDASVLQALKTMEHNDVDILLVLEGEKLVGILTESDYMRKVALHSRSPKHIQVKEIMSRKLITATPDMRSNECIELMIHNNIQHLPVVENQRVVGVIFLSDAVKSTIFHQQDTIRFLEDLMLLDLEAA
jgi:CBS domain-containing protein